MWFSLRIVLLGLWVGAMAAFAFLFAPIAFAHVGPTPAFAATIAASVNAVTKTGDWFGIAAVAITVFTRLESRRRAAVIVACVALAIAFGFVETQIIVPQMQSTPLLTPAYDALHRKSSGVYSIVLLAALAAFVASAQRSSYGSSGS